MSFEMPCPHCGTNVKLPETAQMATCPRCARTFRAVRPVEADASAARLRTGPADASYSDDEDDVGGDREPKSVGDGAFPAWVSPWGFSAFLLGGLGLLVAPMVVSRWLTVSCCLLALVCVGIGMVQTAGKRQGKDIGWLSVGAIFALTLLTIALAAPGMLNRYWGINVPVARRDQDQLVASSSRPDDKGGPLTADDSVDAATDSIGQDGVAVRVMSVQFGQVEERGAKRYLLARIRVSCAGQQPVRFEGFASQKQQPELRGRGGEIYAFVEQRKRKMPAGGVVFLAGPMEPVEIQPKKLCEIQLVFEPPPEPFTPVVLALPASAWGRKGVYKYRIDGLFEPNIPVVQKN